MSASPSAVARPWCTDLGSTRACRYAAPEIMRGDPYGTPVDVYSFGVTLFELMARAYPDGGIESSPEVGIFAKMQFMRSGGTGAAIHGPC